MSWNEHGCWVGGPNAVWVGKGTSRVEVKIAYNYGGEPYETHQDDENGNPITEPAIRGWRYGISAWVGNGGFGFAPNLCVEPYETAAEANRKAVEEVRCRLGDEIADAIAVQLRVHQPDQLDLFGGL